jgi:hypothetical protein
MLVEMSVIAAFMLFMGAAMGLVWTRDIISAEQLDVLNGRLRARDPESGTLMLPHWIAEYATAAALLAGGSGLLSNQAWGEPLSFVALGALVYTSTNSLGWALARPTRLPYAVPMVLGSLGGVAAIAGLWTI